METVVYKYPLSLSTRSCVTMPKGADVLCVQVQYNEPYIWARVDPSKEDQKDRNFIMVGTGHLVPKDASTYIFPYMPSQGPSCGKESGHDL